MIDLDWAGFARHPAGTPVLAFVTTLHFALLVLRDHRARGRRLPVGAVSLAFTVFPWFLPSPLCLLAGLTAHAAWFVACEKLIGTPGGGAVPRSSGPAVQRPSGKAPAPDSSAARLGSPAARKPDRSNRFADVTVLAAFDETPEIRTFRLTRPEGFAFEPGQFLIVRVEIDGKTLSRCYSICSAPSAGYLEISVRRQGTVSRHLHTSLTPGSTLRITGPGGAFVHPPGDRPLVLLAGGIGITPLLSMLRHTLGAEPARPVVLILSARTSAAVPFADELRVLERRYPSFRLAITLTGGQADGCHRGRVDRRLLESVVGDPRAAVWMICGPLPMIDEMRELVASLGVEPSQIHFEKFETATAAAAAAARETQAGAGRVTFARSGAVVPIASGKTVLDLAESAGVSIDTMCRAGVCGTCRTRLASGSVTGDFEALDHADRAAGWILACVAVPSGDCVVEA